MERRERRNLSSIVDRSAPSLILIPSSSSGSFSLQFRPDEDFWISSTIELTWNQSDRIGMQRTISNASNSFLFVDASIPTRTSDLFLPSRILPCGIYRLSLMVMLNTSSNTTRLSKSVYVQINPAATTVNLVPLGTSLISRGEGQDLQLNPGLYSIDLDEEQFNPSVNPSSRCSSSLMDSRIGLMNIIVESTGCRISPACEVFWFRWMTLVLIHRLLRVWIIERIENRNRSKSNSLSNCRGNGSSWRYLGVSGSSKSSLIIAGGSFLANRTY